MRLEGLSVCGGGVPSASRVDVYPEQDDGISVKAEIQGSGLQPRAWPHRDALSS